MRGEQIRAARALVGWTANDLAKASGVSYPTVQRLDATRGEVGGRHDTVQSIRTALEAAGVEFIPENGGGAGVRLAKRDD